MTLKEWRSYLNKAFIIPQRYILGILGFFALINSSIMRVILSMTITQMVYNLEHAGNIVGETCPDINVPNNTSVLDTIQVTAENRGADRYDWDEATQGFLLSAFFYGLLVTYIPGGLLAEKFGGKWVVGTGILVTSVATLLTPLTVFYGGAYGLFIIRFIGGLGQGTVTPSFTNLISRWVPPSERSRFAAMIFGGAQLGNTLGPSISGLIMHDGGNWANVFYLFGSLGVTWCAFWIFLGYSTPNDHPFISDEEKIFLTKNITASALNKKLDPVPIKALFRSTPLWVLILAEIGHDWGYFTMVTKLPKYFSDVLKFNIKETGMMSALPYLAMYTGSIIFAGLCDLCVKKKWHSITTGRKLYATISATIPAVFLMLASYSGCNRLSAVCFFVASMGFMGGFYCSVKINIADIAPNYSGFCSGLIYTFAAFSGILTPYITGLLTPDQTVDQWRIAFWLVFAALVVTNIVYVIWGSGDQQWWDDVEKYGYPSDWKHGLLKRRNEGIEKK